LSNEDILGSFEIRPSEEDSRKETPDWFETHLQEATPIYDKRGGPPQFNTIIGGVSRNKAEDFLSGEYRLLEGELDGVEVTPPKL
jgi:hypothetical protein